ncbi:hypothetical protein ID144_17330 [Pseudomonas sp. JM0905a]|uniref:hypothetical protein n=1 Tax=Pseudomonas sp. JM0905a TaxID=2772484 RepID=UPI001684875E|nr:hypothetical protein [Pseudomonas sp. JM0905a]MBD2838809.1 hypothetical protein [Pseudomonas sp. JM0905a]
MKRPTALTIPVLLLAAALAASVLAATDPAASGLAADDPLAADPAAVNAVLRFRGGIGVIPVSSGQGLEAIATVVNRNLVRGVQPAGQIWVIRNLNAQVSATGDLVALGRGLVLGGGNSIGRATGQSVFATLFCGAVEPFTEHSTNLAGVPLTDEGDFVIRDAFTPAPPTPCDSPVLLIRNAANQSWFAAGIPRARNVQPDEVPPIDNPPPVDNPPPADNPPAEPPAMP